MELNEIRLNGLMLEGLYQRTLVDIRPQDPDTITGAGSPATSAPKFLGSYASRILVFISNPDVAYLPENQLEFLTKILGACKLNMGDIAIINTVNYPDVAGVVGILQPRHIISFGVAAPMGSRFSVEGPSIHELMNNSALKSALWTSLKQEFQL